MKQQLTVLLLVMSMFYSTTQAQNLTPQATQRLGSEAKDLDLQATETMMEFLVKPDTGNFRNGHRLWQKSLKNYEQVMTKGTLNGGAKMLNSLDAMIYSVSKSLVDANLALFGQSLLESTMKETEKDRSKKVNFNGQSYPISKTNRERFEGLEAALNRLKK
jgi:hypothetical protein